MMAQYFCSNFTFFFCLTWLFPYLKGLYQLGLVEAGQPRDHLVENLVLLGLSSYFQQFFVGLIIVLGVSITAVQYLRAPSLNDDGRNGGGPLLRGRTNDGSLTLGLDWSHLLEFDKTLLDANDLMAQTHLRHLGVTKDGQLVGMISVRDLVVFLTNLPRK